MDEILAKASNQAVSFAIRSGITLASGYAIKTVSKLMDKMPAAERDPLFYSKAKLDTKLRSVTEIISLIKLDNDSRNSILEPTVELIQSLEKEINDFNSRMRAVVEETTKVTSKDSINIIKKELACLHSSLNEIVPFLSLALNATSLCADTFRGITSISNLMFASSHILSPRAGTARYVGPKFDLKFFSVFYNASLLKSLDTKSNALTWKEEFARCEVQLVERKRDTGEFYFTLDVTESFDDNRYHDEERPQSRQFDIQDVVRQFFTVSGKILKLETSDSLVLVLKVRRNSEGFDYIAFSEYKKGLDNCDSESDCSSDNETQEDKRLQCEVSKGDDRAKQPFQLTSQLRPNTLATFYYLIMMASIEQAEQCQICEVKDEKLLKFLSSGGLYSSRPQSRKERAAENNQELDLESNTMRLNSLRLQD